MDVVDRDDERGLASEALQHSDHAGGDRSPGRRLEPGLLAKQRDGKRAALRCGQLGAHLVERPVEQVAKSGERDLRLGPARSRAQNAVPLRPGPLDAGSPQRRLANARLAFEQERPRPLLSQEGVDVRELLVAPDDLVSRHAHARPS